MEENKNPTTKRPLFINPNVGKSSIPRPLLWILSCCFGCFVLSFGFIFIVSWLVGVLAMAGNTTISQDVIKDGTSTDSIAVIPITGVLVDDFEGSNSILDFQSSITTNRINNLLDIASNDKTVKAIILRENTPGGSTLAMRKICQKVESIDKNKPIYTYIESEGASAGYYIANCSRYIIADKEAITGSIGALVQATDIQGLLDKLGIKTKTITNTQGIYKDDNLFSQNSKDEQKIKGILDSIYSDFVQKVSEGRSKGQKKLTIDQVKTYATGEIFSGEDALKSGLIDGIGMFDDAINTVVSKEVLSSDTRVVQYSYNSGLFSSMSSIVNGITNAQKNITMPVSFETIYAIKQ